MTDSPIIHIDRNPPPGDGAASSLPCVSAVWVYSGVSDKVQDTLTQYVAALSELSVRAELIIVATEGLESEVFSNHELASPSFPLTVVSLHRQCDEAAALRAGVNASRGNIIVQFPRYLESDPSAVRELVREIGSGADVVVTWRNPRVDSGWGLFQTRAFNKATRLFSGVPLHDLNSGFRAFSREAFEALDRYTDYAPRYLGVLAACEGFNVSEVKVKHVAQLSLERGSLIRILMRRASDLLTLFFLLKYNRRPLRFFGFLGSASLGIGVLLTGFLGIQRLLDYSGPLSERPGLALGVLLIALGVQLFSIGLLGELIAFTFGRRPAEYHLRRVHRFGGERDRNVSPEQVSARLVDTK